VRGENKKKKKEKKMREEGRNVGKGLAICEKVRIA